MPSYIIRDIDAELWKQVKAKAASEGKTVKQAVRELLAVWVGLDMVLPNQCVRPMLTKNRVSEPIRKIVSGIEIEEV